VAGDLAAVDAQDLAGDVGRGLQKQDAGLGLSCAITLARRIEETFR